MSRISAVSLFLMILLGCAPAGRLDDDAPAAAMDAGFDPAELDAATRPQDDFYGHVNGLWIEKTQIPPERTRYGTMTILFEETEQQVRDLIEQSDSADLRKARDIYASFMNEELAENLGTMTLAAELEKISALRTREQLTTYMADALAMGIEVPLDFYIDADAADTDRSLAYF